MSRIEKIKEQLKEYNRVTHTQDDYEDFSEELEYLLSKLELAENELQWTFEREGWLRTKEVLESIRED